MVWQEKKSEKYAFIDSNSGNKVKQSLVTNK